MAEFAAKISGKEGKMNEKPAEDTFGNYLAYYRYQTKGSNGKFLSQDLFAEAVNQVDPDLMINADTVFKLEKGIRKINANKRSLLVAILKVLISTGGIKSQIETNYLVELSGLKALDIEETLSLPPYRADDQYYLYETKNTAPATPKRVYSGSYKKSQDPMNFSRVDSFYRSQNNQVEDEISPGLFDVLMEASPMYSLSDIEPAGLSLFGLIIRGIKKIVKKKS